MFTLDDVTDVGVGETARFLAVLVFDVVTPPILDLICCNTESRFAGLAGDLLVVVVARLLEDFEEEGEEREGLFFPKARRRR